MPRPTSSPRSVRKRTRQASATHASSATGTPVPATSPLAGPRKSRAASTGNSNSEGTDPSRDIFVPSFTVVFRLLACIRAFGALMMPLGDCDEVYNYWEPMHYLQFGRGLQTWEYDPQYGIRSWAYTLLYTGLAKLLYALSFSGSKLRLFYAVRVVLALVTATCEARFYRSTVRYIHPRVGRYLLVLLMGSAGLFHAAHSFLPSTFAMNAILWASPYWLRAPSPSSGKRVYYGALGLAVGALVGWPFAAAVAIPFALEELAVCGTTLTRTLSWRVSPAADAVGNPKRRWVVTRIFRLMIAGILGLTVLLPIVLVDRFFYRQWLVVPWNIIRYNVFSQRDGRGPELYGTEPWYFYLLNGLLNFNIALPLALGCLPTMALVHVWDRCPGRRAATSAGTKPVPLGPLVYKVGSFYMLFAIFSLQPHKEERFLYVVYPTLCLAAAVTLHLVRDRVAPLLRSFTNCRVTRYLPMATLTLLVGYVAVSSARVAGLFFYYQAPMAVYSHFYTHAKQFPAPLTNSSQAPTLCVGKEWYRFPSHYFVPYPYRVGFIPSSFHGQLPKYFAEPKDVLPRQTTDTQLPLWAWPPQGTYLHPTGFNDMNQEEPDRYVSRQ
ncbi:mannosyltransferase [Dimargaris verticillata]|uniref:Mannosyltransferase n=1 Tax=Dimargaris verticillata TaxID=2761393 RepID=A0A9W8B2J6_9FUNG|nr:mannosyltransferase [Dimargaris verticillata]